MNIINERECKISNEILDKLPDWWKQINNKDYYLVCTDDCDSLFSCQRLHTLFGMEIGGFYSFEKGLFLNDEITDNGWKTPIYVDLSIGDNQCCFDNHMTFLPNSNRVNPNVIPHEYKNKYNFSTLTLIIALYGGVEKLSEKLKTMLLAVDGGYIGYYKDGGKWKDVNIYWLKQLGLADYLLPILESHNMKYFQDFSARYGLNDKILIDKNGYLDTPTYKVPNYPFKLATQTQKIFTSKYDAQQRFKNKEKILVAAETFKSSYVINIAV